MARRQWTEEQCARQAQLISSWQPWARSSGPVTPAGKARVSRNAFRGGARGALRLAKEIARLIKDDERCLARILASPAKIPAQDE